MYDEMESQIREEREHAAQVERDKAERLRQEMDAELRGRDEQIQAMMRKYSTVSAHPAAFVGQSHPCTVGRTTGGHRRHKDNDKTGE
jgi:hypothetical protein